MSTTVTGFRVRTRTGLPVRSLLHRAVVTAPLPGEPGADPKV
ncbi:hypothetical protein ACFC5Z_21855 [Streptomyces sp. NPDC056004]